MPNKKRSLEYAGQKEFDNYVDSVRTANILDSIRQARFNDYRNIISDEMYAEVQQNKADVKKYGPLAIVPLFYRAGKDMLFGKESDKKRKAREEAIQARKAYETFIGK